MSAKLFPSKEKRYLVNIEQQNILEAALGFNNFIVNAGAGAGKTFSMVKLINDITKRMGEYLFFNNKKILCITYTNTAKDEMLIRVKDKNYAQISTIHSFVWSEMKDYQKELKSLVIRSMETELNEEFNKVKDYSDYTVCIKKLDDLQEMISKGNLSKYYEISNLNASGYKDALNQQLGIEVSNVSNTKRVIRYFIKKNRYEPFTSNNEELPKVKYDELMKIEKLEKSRIGHDRVLEYFGILCDESQFFRNKIGSKYPFILIDEFQDTHQYVIDAFKRVSSDNQDVVIGMFGDPAQAIYENGIGIFDDNDFLSIEKKFNWRSLPKLVNISNFFRIDKSNKESVFDVTDEGSFCFYAKEINTESDLIEETEILREKWDIDDQTIHIFLNRINLIANINGFKEIYDIYRSAIYYNIGTNYLFFNEEFMNFDRLSPVSKILYDIMKLKDFGKNGGLISDLIPLDNFTNGLEEAIIKDVSNVSKEIIAIDEALNIYDYIENLFQLFENAKKDNNQVLCNLLGYILVYDDLAEMINSFNVQLNNILPSFEIERSINEMEKDLNEQFTVGKIKSKDDILEFFNSEKYGNLKTFIIDENEEDEYIERVYQNKTESHIELINRDNEFDISIMLKKEISQFDYWYAYLKRQEYDDESSKEIYQTLHSSKGREYDNVVILLEKGIRSNTSEFDKVLSKLISGEIINEKNEIIALNQLHVGLSRAIKNLCLIYNSDPTDNNTSFIISEINSKLNN